ncbi:cyclin-D4-1-like [Wolffia australiana]
MESTHDCSSAILFCGEDNRAVLGLGEEDDVVGVLRGAQLSSQPQTEDCLELLVLRESHHLPREDYFSRLLSGVLDLSIRIDAIDWICKVHAHHGFGPLCLYLAVNYLDRFLSLYELPGKAWMVQLLSVACLSLAAKMDETEVPLSLDLQVGEARFVFEAKTIQRMELLVLSTLQWRMQAITPFSFLDFFLRRSSSGRLPAERSVFRSVGLVLKMIRGTEFLEFRPSEIAAAVAAEVAGSPVCGMIHLDDRRLQRCCELVRAMAMAEAERGGAAGSGNIGSVPQSPIGVLDAACLSYKSDSNGHGGAPRPKRRKKDDGNLDPIERR